MPLSLSLRYASFSSLPEYAARPPSGACWQLGKGRGTISNLCDRANSYGRTTNRCFEKLEMSKTPCFSPPRWGPPLHFCPPLQAVSSRYVSLIWPRKSFHRCSSVLVCIIIVFTRSTHSTASPLHRQAKARRRRVRNASLQESVVLLRLGIPLIDWGNGLRAARHSNCVGRC